MPRIATYLPPFLRLRMPERSDVASSRDAVYPMLPVAEPASVFAMVAGSDEVLEVADIVNNFFAFWVDFLDDCSFWSGYRLLPAHWSDPIEHFISRLWFLTVVIDLWIVMTTFYLRTEQIRALEKRAHALADYMDGRHNERASNGPTRFSAGAAGVGVAGPVVADKRSSRDTEESLLHRHPELATRSRLTEDCLEMQAQLRRLQAQRIKAFIYIWKFLGDMGTAVLGVLDPKTRARYRALNWCFGLLSGSTSLLAQWRAAGKKS